MTVILLALAPAIFATSILSGLLGMGGGMILMGLYALALPVGAAMVLHGVTQLAANGSRAWFLRGHIRWPVLGPYLLGAGLSTGAFLVLAITVETATVLLLLGLVPLTLTLLPSIPTPPIERRGGALLCGLTVTALQLLAGVSGAMLDLFFLRSRLDRFEIVATKAMTQSLGHLIKILYFGALVAGDEAAALPLWAYPLAVVMALAGTSVGARLLERLSEARFRRYSAALVIGIGVVFTARGLGGLL